MLDDGGHDIIHGTRKAVTRCEDELIHIHIPGAIQSYGLLLALRRHCKDVFIPRIVSENSYSICRYQPSKLLSSDCFDLVMPGYQPSLFNNRLHNIRRRAQDDTREEHKPMVFAFSFLDPKGQLIPCWCAANYLGGDVDLYVCEFRAARLFHTSLGQPSIRPPSSTS